MLVVWYWIILFYWLAIFMVYFYLHEFAGHFLVNWLSGIQISQMGVMWAEINHIKIFPFAISVIGVGAPQASTISRFSGGFMAGAILAILSSVLFRLYKDKMKLRFFWLFAVTLGFSLAGVAESIFEGFFLEYHRGKLESVILLFLIIGFPILLTVCYNAVKSKDG